MDEMMRTLHEVACSCGCGFCETEQGIAYSARHLQITRAEGGLRLSGQYDLREFLRFYREEASEAERALLFAAASPCSHCISDKCTTLLMAPKRTIEFQGQTKKLCGPFRHGLSIEVGPDNLDACARILRMMLAGLKPFMHCAAPLRNDVSYRLAEEGAFYLLGFLLRHTPVSPTDEEFLRGLLASGKLPRAETYVGAIDNFMDGAHYEFLFGVRLTEKPDSVPEGMVLRKIRAGEWAVYNSSARDYPSIWRHFTASLYDLEKKGYDRARIPFEYYDADGNWSDVHIPVDADEPKDAGRVVTLQWLPNMVLAGFMNFAECDHPEYVERDFDGLERVRTLFPDRQMQVRASIHQLFGKPLRGIEGVPIDDFTPLPEGVELHEMQGGLWRLSKYRHFNGEYEDWPFDVELDARMPLNTCQHPRAFNQYIFPARGGYSEIGVPMRPGGESEFVEVEVAPFPVYAKLEDPLNGQVVPDAEFKGFFDHPANAQPGTLVVGYRVQIFDGVMLYSEPLVKGFPAGPDQPRGFARMELGGGRYVRIREPGITREPGWDVEWICSLREKCGKDPDPSHRCFLIERERGARFEIYIPV